MPRSLLRQRAEVASLVLPQLKSTILVLIRLRHAFSRVLEDHQIWIQDLLLPDDRRKNRK
jgi:hypothetical protein